MAQTVIGMFDNATEAQQAVQQLVSSGFSRDSIDISSGSTTENMTSSTGADYNSGTTGETGYAAGSGTSGYTGSTDYKGTTGTPGYTGSMDYNTGADSTDYTRNTSRSTDRNEGVGNSISRFFKSLFGNDDDDVNTYSNVAQRSGSIVTVHAESKEEAERAADILDDNGAVDVNEKANQYGYTGNTGYTNTDKLTDNIAEGTSIPIIEEQMEIGKRKVQTGGVRLRSRIVEKPVEESLRLREERVRVERNAVDRPATDADFDNFKETEMELTEESEVPVVSKQARVVEEVTLDKEVEEREETVRDTVRSTEVDVENLENKNIRKGTSTDNWSDKKDKL